MSFNIGEKNSKFVAVSNVTMRFAFSEKVLFADLRTSHKTGNPKINKETGEIITDAQGNPVPERIYTHWEGLSEALKIPLRTAIQSLNRLTACGVLIRTEGEKTFPRSPAVTVICRKFYEKER